eukprot:scaffold8410_cov220-Pinguiococcus_pyrenoidosus.AAC.1
MQAGNHRCSEAEGPKETKELGVAVAYVWWKQHRKGDACGWLSRGRLGAAPLRRGLRSGPGH